MSGSGMITLTTDYGLGDGFVGVLHGVIARQAPDIRVIDITHDVHPGDIARAAAVLAQSAPYFPPAVHVAVVDPGVGTDRRGLALRAGDHYLVGPDNGVLLPAAEALGGVTAALALTNAAWHEDRVFATFHGRDVFAPVAARLAGGAGFAEAGSPVEINTLVRLPEPAVSFGDGFVEAEVRTVDRFGNVQLAVRSSDGLHAIGGGAVLVAGQYATCQATFGDVARGKMIIFGDSAGYLAIAVNSGLAVAELGVAPGDLVRIDRV